MKDRSSPVSSSTVFQSPTGDAAEATEIEDRNSSAANVRNAFFIKTLT
jgi:hypothetical protein